MADYASWAYGGTQYPLTTIGSNTLLRDADPALFYTIDFFQSVLTTYMGARLLVEAAKSPPITQITAAIMAVTPFDPAPYLTENQGVRFPLLSVYRSKDTAFEDKTIAWPHRVGEWVVQYTLPPLNAGQMERIGPIMKTVGDILHNRIETMFDPSYQSGLKVWQAAGIESIKLGPAEFGRWELGDALNFYTWKAKLYVAERVSNTATTLGLLGGIDNAIDLASPAQPSITDFVDNQITYVDPTTIPGIVSLWTPDAAVTAADGEHVASVTCSISANILSQATAANQPILARGMLTNFAGVQKAVLRFDGVATSLVATVAQLANDSSRTIVALVRLSDTTKRSSVVAQTLTADTGAHTLAIEANTAGTAGGKLGIFTGGSSYDAQAPADPGWRVLSLTITATTNGATVGSTTTFQVDGGAAQPMTLKSGTGSWQGMSTANQIVLGAIPGIAGTNAACDLGPVLVFNSALTSAQLLTATTYCKQWGGLP